MSRESSESNLDYPQFQKISLSSSSQPRVTTSEKTSSFKATISKNVNNGLLEDPKKSSLSSSQPSKILNQGPEITEDGSPINQERPPRSCRFIHKSKSQPNEIGAKSQETALKNPETFLLENSKVLELITEKNSSSDATDVKKPQDDTGKSIQVKKNFIKPSKPSLYIEDLSEEDLKNLCKDEIFWVKKRFQKKIISENGNSFEVYFYPSDPEWPFEVKFIELCIEIPEEYPKEICSINCLNKDGTLPVILLRHINKTMKDWLLLKFEASKNLKKVELLLRPFCKWLDRNLQDIFIEGLKKVKKDLEAKAAGIEFVPCEDILEMSQKEFENFNEETFPSDTTPPDSSEENNESNPLVKPPKAQADFPMFTPKRGTEIKLRNLELTDQAGTLSCRKLALTLQCGRCRFRSDIITPPNRLNKIICSRCHHNQQATFRPQLLHQFLAVLGYLDLEECSIIDIPLSKCNFSIGCLNCNRSVDAEGLQFGQKQNIWCLYCNSKMGIKIESVKFQYLQLAPIVTGTAKELKLGKIIRKVHDPAIQEGKPLPDSGACKHYKKSFRWLRFPCCGKAYPCDLCHDEKETDHEMKRANRMICGFCAKEQPYTNGKDCISCLSSMNRRTGTHWEGGKGCRDKVKMSREDKQKYRGVSKIISKKAQLAKAEVWEKVF